MVASAYTSSTAPSVVMRPIEDLRSLFVNHSAPSDPTAIPLPGTEMLASTNLVIDARLVVIRPMARKVEAGVIGEPERPVGASRVMRPGYSTMPESGVAGNHAVRRDPPDSGCSSQFVNQSAPSGPAVIPCGLLFSCSRRCSWSRRRLW